MSAPAFQSALARLIVDEDFQARVLAGEPGALAGDLTDLERRRLRAVAGDRGLGITRTLHKGFRLGKVLALVPLTCRLLGDDRVAQELRSFWRGRLPTSFYFVEETIDFCDHLLAECRSGGEVAAVDYLPEVVAYERAALELQRSRPDGDEPPPQTVELAHDPATLIGYLSRGAIPTEVPERRCRLVGRRTAGGELEWKIVDGDRRQAPLSAPPVDRPTRRPLSAC